MRLSDKEAVSLISRYRGGDDGALEELLKACKPLVLAKCRPYFLAGADKEDLIQEGMLGLYKAVIKFDASLKPAGGGERSSFAGFASMCIERRVLSAVKASMRDKHKPLNESLKFSDPEAEAAAYSAEEQYIEALTAEDRLNTMLSGLTELETGVLKFYADGLSYKEIGERLGITAKAVDNALARVKKKTSNNE